MPLNDIEYKGKTFLFLNINGMTEQDVLIEDAKKAAKTIIERNEPTRFLCDFTNASFGVELMNQIKDDGKYILKNIPMKTAITGITGLKQILLQGYIRFTGSKLRVFNTLEEAKDYLAEDEFPQ